MFPKHSCTYLKAGEKFLLCTSSVNYPLVVLLFKKTHTFSIYWSYFLCSRRKTKTNWCWSFLLHKLQIFVIKKICIEQLLSDWPHAVCPNLLLQKIGLKGRLPSGCLCLGYSYSSGSSSIVLGWSVSGTIHFLWTRIHYHRIDIPYTVLYILYIYMPLSRAYRPHLSAGVGNKQT